MNCELLTPFGFAVVEAELRGFVWRHVGGFRAKEAGVASLQWSLCSGSLRGFFLVDCALRGLVWLRFGGFRAQGALGASWK